MMGRAYPLMLAAKARQPGSSRESIPTPPRRVSYTNLSIIRRIDGLYLLHSLVGKRML